jgi:hypothetical protein
MNDLCTEMHMTPRDTYAHHMHCKRQSLHQLWVCKSQKAGWTSKQIRQSGLAAQVLKHRKQVAKTICEMYISQNLVQCTHKKADQVLHILIEVARLILQIRR